jgi:hypothetical protein
MDKWANWQPIVKQGTEIACNIHLADYLVYAEWGKIRAALKIESKGIKASKLEIYNLPITNKLIWGVFKIEHKLIYTGHVWSTGDGILHFGQYPTYFGESPTITLKNGDAITFEADLIEVGVAHPNIPLNLMQKVLTST